MRYIALLLLAMGCNSPPTEPAEIEGQFAEPDTVIYSSGFWMSATAGWDDAYYSTDSAFVIVTFTIGYAGPGSTDTVRVESRLHHLAWADTAWVMSELLEIMRTDVPPPNGYWKTNAILFNLSHKTKIKYDIYDPRWYSVLSRFTVLSPQGSVSSRTSVYILRGAT